MELKSSRLFHFYNLKKKTQSLRYLNKIFKLHFHASNYKLSLFVYNEYINDENNIFSSST